MSRLVEFTGNANQKVLVVPRMVVAIIQRNDDCTLVMRGGNGLDINESTAVAVDRLGNALGN